MFTFALKKYMILITGGLGFIGSNTAEALVKMDETCVLTMHHNSNIPGYLKEYAGHNIFTEQADLNDKESLLAIGEKYKITAIVHLSSPPMGTADILEDVRANINGLCNVAEVARQWGVKRVVVASTIGVYDPDSAIPLREDAKLSMNGAHAIQAAKKSFEILGDVMASRTGINIVFARIAAIWGPGGRARSVFFSAPQLIHAAAKEDTSGLETVYTDDGIDLCYVKDCAQGLALLATTATLRHRIYNVGSGRLTTNGEVMDAIREVVPELSFNVAQGHNPGSHARGIYLDIQRLQHDTGFVPRYDIKKSAAEYMAWLKAANVK